MNNFNQHPGGLHVSNGSPRKSAMGYYQCWIFCCGMKLQKKLTEQEHLVIHHSSDTKDFCDDIHRLQRNVMHRVAYRTNPEKFPVKLFK